MDPDRDDLRAYVTTADTRAFARVVARHADMVYSACLRQLKDPAAAEDAAQQVFALLASKAATLRSNVPLVGWLYNTARYVALNDRRRDQRRRRHERHAALREDQTMADANDESRWADVSEVL